MAEQRQAPLACRHAHATYARLWRAIAAALRETQRRMAIASIDNRDHCRPHDQPRHSDQRQPAAPPARRAERPLQILFLVSAHNSLSQRVFVALTDLGHDVSVEVVDSSGAIEAAVARHTPELIVCPMLKSVIPESVWSRHRCLIVHPGPRGDRGPSSLDWAIELEMAEWGVTVLEATGEVDGGGVWASRTFRMRQAERAACTAMRPGAPRSRPSSMLCRRSPPASGWPSRSTTAIRAWSAAHVR